MAVVTAFGFFGSILLHELGHAVQATRDGMTIDGITLWLFGGVARFTGMFPTAAAEFRIAVAGPLVSLALGAGFLGITRIPGLPEPVNGVCSTSATSTRPCCSSTSCRPFPWTVGGSCARRSGSGGEICPSPRASPPARVASSRSR